MITDYLSLQAAVLDYANKDDPAARITDFIALAEARLNPILRQTTSLPVPFSLSDAAPTNVLLTTYPNLYLAAAVLESAFYWEDDGKAARWSARLNDALEVVKANVGRAKGGARLHPDPALARRDYDRLGFDPSQSPDL